MAAWRSLAMHTWEVRTQRVDKGKREWKEQKERWDEFRKEQKHRM